MSTTVAKIGIVAAPGISEKIARNLEIDLPNILSNQYDNSIEWKVETVIDPLTGSAETVHDIFTKITDYQDNNNWKYTIGLTDLPVIEQ